MRNFINLFESLDHTLLYNQIKDQKHRQKKDDMDIKKDELTGVTAGTYSNLEVNYKKDNLNILEALQYLFKGKKIKHKKSNNIYQILNNVFCVYTSDYEKKTYLRLWRYLETLLI
jgi:hypothetical protein